MSCDKGSYCPKCGTWGSKCGTLTADNWAPYSGEPWFSENYCTAGNPSCSSGYNQSAGYGHGCSYNGGNCNKCSPYNKLGSDEKKEHYYASKNTSWTVGNNVTPFNHQLKYNYTKWESKEGYPCGSCKPSPYLRSNQTWKGQKPYQT